MPVSVPSAADVTLRPVSDTDDALLDVLFASTRGAELAGLPPEMRGTFVGMQRMAQERGWAAAFPDLRRSIVVVEGADAGRLYVDMADDITVVDITLLPAAQGRGVGTHLISDILTEATARGCSVQLSVEPDNRARRLYERLGFTARGGDELRLAMRWTPAAGPTRTGIARVAAPADAGTVTDLIVEAFYDDPTWSWAFPDAARRREQHRRFWRLYVDAALRHREVWLAPQETSASVWIPPGESELNPEEEEHVEHLLHDLLGSGAAQVLEAFELFETAHPRDEPHYYLSLLATDPRHRGHGYGLRLLADNLARIDERRLPAYLEASNPANVPLYERYGFRVVRHFDLPQGGPRVHTMWREARSEGA